LKLIGSSKRRLLAAIDVDHIRQALKRVERDSDRKCDLQQSWVDVQPVRVEQRRKACDEEVGKLCERQCA